MCSSGNSAGNRARANWAIGLSSTVAANRAAANVKEGWSQASRPLQQQPCFSLTGVFFYAPRFSKLGGRRPPAAVVGRGPGAGRGGAPHPTRGFGPADPKKQGRRVGLSQPHVAWAAWTEAPCAKSLLVELFTSQNLRTRVGRWWEKLGACWAPTPGMIQRGDTFFKSLCWSPKNGVSLGPSATRRFANAPIRLSNAQ